MANCLNSSEDELFMFSIYTKSKNKKFLQFISRIPRPQPPTPLHVHAHPHHNQYQLNQCIAQPTAYHFEYLWNFPNDFLDWELFFVQFIKMKYNEFPRMRWEDENNIASSTNSHTTSETMTGRWENCERNELYLIAVVKNVRQFVEKLKKIKWKLLYL